MDIEKITIRKAPVDENFDYQTLYSESRGAVFKEEMKFLISEAISEQEIKVEKIVIAENVKSELFKIIDTKGPEGMLLRLLKNHFRESEYHFAPMIYMLKKLDSDFSLSTGNGKLEIVSDLFEVEIRPKINEMNAEPRLFFPNEKIAFTSTNDDIENLADVLGVKGVTVYAIDTDTHYNDIYAYKINRTERFFEVAEQYRKKVLDEVGKQFFKYQK